VRSSSPACGLTRFGTHPRDTLGSSVRLSALAVVGPSRRRRRRWWLVSGAPPLLGAHLPLDVCLAAGGVGVAALAPLGPIRKIVRIGCRHHLLIIIMCRCSYSNDIWT